MKVYVVTLKFPFEEEYDVWYFSKKENADKKLAALQVDEPLYAGMYEVDTED